MSRTTVETSFRSLSTTESWRGSGTVEHSNGADPTLKIPLSEPEPVAVVGAYAAGTGWMKASSSWVGSLPSSVRSSLLSPRRSAPCSL